MVGQDDRFFLLDIFLYDRTTGLNTLVSHNTTSTTSVASGESDYATISADGRFVTYESTAPNLVTGQVDASNSTDVFVYDRTTGLNVLVSHNVNSAVTASNGFSDSPFVSANGQYIAFFSESEDLIANQINTSADIFLYEVATGLNTLVSHTAASTVTAGDDKSRLPVISNDGRFVAFQSRAIDLISGQIDGDSTEDVFLYDRTTNTNTLVSHIPGSSVTTVNNSAVSPVISGNGQFVSFRSRAINLVAGQDDTNNRDDLFLYNSPYAVGLC